MRVIKGYTFDDVLLVPQHSEVESRKDVDLSVDLGKGVRLSIPIVSANMKTVTGPQMAATLASQGGLGILNRFSETREQDIKQVFLYQKTISHGTHPIGFSIGVRSRDYEKGLLERIMSPAFEITAPKAVCIDVAHGDHTNCLRMVNWVASKFPDVLLIAGNVATGDGAKRLVSAGADVVKVGIGPGSLCTTRVETGNGVPQLTALDEVYAAVGKQAKIIADGGIRSAGDIVKALCFSHAVMIGNLFAGTDEAPGSLIQRDGLKYKTYVGSSTHKGTHVEGVAALVPYKGPVNTVIEKLIDGITSGLSYQGCFTLEELREEPLFVTVSHAGIVESRPHDVHY